MVTKYFRVLALAALVLTTIGPSAASAQTTVNTSATVQNIGGGTGNAGPRIECKWELPDMDSSTGGIQYVNAGASDDDTSRGPTLADGSTATTPCNLPTGAAEPSQADGLRHMIQVRPNPHDLPEQRRVQLWAAVDLPTDGSGILDVNWDVYHPDGTLKTEKHGAFVTVEQCIAAYNNTGGAGSLLDMINAAIRTGQVSSAAAKDAQHGLLYWCTQQAKRLYFAEFQISKHQPCGEYRIQLNARAGNGAISVLNNYIDVICYFNLVLDFNAVNFGTITPGAEKKVNGDVVMETPVGVAQNPGPVLPTVQNTGNSGMKISIQYSPMVGPGGNQITEFDACFAAAANYNAAGQGVSAKPIFCVPQIFSSLGAASLLDNVASGKNTTLCPNRMGKLDLSVHPQSGIPDGVYTGTVTVIGAANKICLTDNGHVDTTTIVGADTPGYPGYPTGDGLQPAGGGYSG